MSKPDELNIAAVNANCKEGSLTLHIPEGIAYNCQQCGSCCGEWAIGLTENDWQKVKDTDWASLHPSLAGRELFLHRQKEFQEGKSAYPHYTKARADGTCPFVVDNRCFIHSYLGEASKPGVCKLFPYSFVSTPTGIYVGLIYSSNAAVRNVGQPLSDQRSTLEKIWYTSKDQELALTKVATDALAKLDTVKTGEKSSSQSCTVSLIKGLNITWEEYLVLENRLIHLLKNEKSVNFCQLLLAEGEIIAEAIRIKRFGKDWSQLECFNPSIDRWLGQSPTMFENLLLSMTCFRNFICPEFRKKHKDMNIGTDKSAWLDPKIIGAALRAMVCKKIVLPSTGTFNLNQCLEMPVNSLSPEIDQFLNRYLYLRLFSKTYFGPALSEFSVLSGYNTMVANFISAIIFAKAHALARKDKSLNLADFYKAFVHIDKELGVLSRLSEERATLYDIGFSSIRLFNRLLGTLAVSIGHKTS